MVYSSPWSCFCCFPFLTSPSSDEHSVCLYDDSFTEGFCSGRRSYLCRSCNLCVTWQSHVSGRFLPPNMNLTVAPPTTVTCVMTSESESEVAQSCPTLCDPMDCSLQAPRSMGFSRQEYWSGLPFPSPGDLPHPGIETGSPAL